MSITKNLEELIESESTDPNSLIDLKEIEMLENKLNDLLVFEKPKGYTLPLRDTIGMNLQGKFSCEIKDKNQFK